MTINNDKDIKITILGCGSSTGVPRVGNEWGDCDPSIPENKRNRCSLLIEKINNNKKTTIVIDTGPDFRHQMNSSNVKKIDAIFYTHEHADHTHGIDDVRMYALRDKTRIDIYASRNTSNNLKHKFGYCFSSKNDSSYPPILRLNEIREEKTYLISGEGGDIKITPILQNHGNINSFGYKVKNFVYSSDLNDIPQNSLKYIQDIELWIVDSLRWNWHPTHFNVDSAVEWTNKLNVKNSILTNLHIDLDYNKLSKYLPSHIKPAYDGLTFVI
tara:strand:- start:10282 stop:11094 length:813 start_codon:yes stop_codon:yes gene_type:complete